MDETPYQSETAEGNPNGAPLRIADPDVKARVLLEGTFVGHHICYRRVKRTNELVIDQHVYDEIEMLIEPPHRLCAVVDGHTIAVGNDGSHSYIAIDGQRVARKFRFS